MVFDDCFCRGFAFSNLRGLGEAWVERNLGRAKPESREGLSMMLASGDFSGGTSLGPVSGQNRRHWETFNGKTVSNDYVIVRSKAASLLSLYLAVFGIKDSCV